MKPVISFDISAVSRIPVLPSLLEVICQSTGMGFACVARVTNEKWIACAVRDEIRFGLESGGELKLETTICHEIRQSGKAVIIDHVDNDSNFQGHPTPKMYGFQSYISIPIILKNGDFFGTLCAIDPRPAQLNNPKIIGMFNLFSDLISFHLNALDELDAAEAKLEEERQTAELREQFIAILGHDLRNPVGAIANSAQLLLTMPLGEIPIRIVNIIKNSSYRMNGLIENMLDFASGRLGAGITLNKKNDEPIEKILHQVIGEIRSIWPLRDIESHFQLAEPVTADGNRVAQLVSNLLGNAITYDKQDEPVRINAISKDGEFKLFVANGGSKIPEAAMARLFQPFYRGEVKPGQQGLGLGLFIASEIARAHGGKLEVSSTDKETRFTLTMPTK